MKKSIYKITFFVFVFCFLLTIQQSFAQKQKSNFFSQPEIYNGVVNPIVCPAGTVNGNWRIPAPASYFASRDKGGKKSATFVVTYNGFSAEAQIAFQKAVDIWESILQSDVTIYVTANWTPLGSGTLGSASPATFFRSGAFPNVNTWYPIALAEKLSGTHLNTIGAADISCNFNSTFNNWYLGLDGNTPANQYDFVSVVLHELGHGLGFIDGTDFDNGVGSFFLGFPFVYDKFMENASGQLITNAAVFPNNTTTFGSALISPLFFKSPILSINNGNQRATLYSPPAFSGGSSTAHVDQDTYEGTINGLMTPSANPGVSEFDPGPIMLSMFADMGWVHTSIKPDTIRSTETVVSSVTVKAKIVSDSVLNVGSIKLHFSADSFKLDKRVVVMTATGVTNEYSGIIPTPNSGKAYAYYVSAKDNTTRTYFSPSEAENAAFAPFRYFYFFMGTDNTPPTITHTAITELPLAVNDTTLLATITDVFGIDTAYVEYQINNVAKPSFGLRLVPDEFNVYSGKFQFPAGTVSANDVIKYRIVAKDNSNANNTAFSPASGFHEFTIIGNSAIQDTYSNNFNTTSNDFFGSYYSITTPIGFNDAAIHTKHPYDDAPSDQQVNYIYQLKVPIRVAATNAFMKFKEIVLVEPGDPGSVFGSNNFWDYVIVEGSKDDGVTWTRLLDGYDSRDQTVWNNRWISGVDASNNSVSSGDPTLYRDRSINLKPTFATNDVILIRFRLLVDEAVYGWGWAIDDLEIQTPVAGLENLLDRDKLVKVYPNPTREILNIDTEFKFAVKKVEVQVTDLAGKPIRSQVFDNNKPVFQEQMNLKGLSAGMYLVNIKVGNQSLVRRIMIQ